MNLPVDRAYIAGTLARLVQIDSTNPSLTPGGAGEREIGPFLAGAMEQLGLAVQQEELAPGRVNVLGRLAGQGRGRTLLLNGHMDTVGVEGMAEPFAGTVRQGRLYGRGAYDMKGSLAAMLGAAKSLVDAGIPLGGDLLLAGVADEEYASMGTARLAETVAADGAIVTEPTDLALCRAHRGFIWYQVETVGRAAHGSRYREGIDANMRMGRFLAELDALEQALRQRPGHPLLGPPSLHAARLEGGTEMSVYAARCRLQIERRTLPGEPEAQVTAELQAIIDRLAAQDPTFQATVRPFFGREAFEVGEDAGMVRLLEGVMARCLGRPPAHIGQSFWTDAALLAAAGIETVLVGPRGHGLHSAEEWVELDSVYDLARILAEAAVDFCRA